jgi:hypothetical protein
MLNTSKGTRIGVRIDGRTENLLHELVAINNTTISDLVRDLINKAVQDPSGPSSSNRENNHPGITELGDSNG